MKVIGIDISDTVARAAELRQRFGSIGIRAIAERELPAYLVQDGHMSDVAAVAEEIKTTLSHGAPQSIKAGGAYMLLPESKVFTHVFTFPRELRPNEIEDAIGIQFVEYFPYEIDDTAYDWKVVQESDQTQMVLVGACEKKYVEQRQELASALGLKLLGVDLESASIARAVLPPAQDLESYLLVDLGARVASLSIFNERGLQSALVLDGCGNKLSEAIMAKTQLPPAKVEELKQVVDMRNRESDEHGVSVVIEDQLMPVVEEIKRSIRFYEGSRNNKVQGIYLCGGIALIAGLSDYIEEQVGLNVQVGNPTTHVKYHDLLQDHKQPIAYSSVVGLMIGMLDKKHHKTRFNFLRYMQPGGKNPLLKMKRSS